MAAYPTYTQIDNGNTSPNNAAPVMTNLNAIVTFINTYLVHLDGAKAMTANLSSNGTDPIAASDYARKFYVDSVFATESAARLAGDKGKTRVGFGVRRVANQALADPPASTVISFDTEDWDTDGFFAPTSTNVTIPAGRGGVYLLTCEFPQTENFSGLGKANRIVDVYVNGAFYSNISAAQVFSFSGSAVYNAGTVLVLLAAADVLTIRHSAENGSATGKNAFSVVFVGERLSV